MLVCFAWDLQFKESTSTEVSRAEPRMKQRQVCVSKQLSNGWLPHIFKCGVSRKVPPARWCPLTSYPHLRTSGSTRRLELRGAVCWACWVNPQSQVPTSRNFQSLVPMAANLLSFFCLDFGVQDIVFPALNWVTSSAVMGSRVICLTSCEVLLCI